MSVEEYLLTRFFLQKGLAFIYLIAFLIIVNQYRALLGKKGILPIENFIKQRSFWTSPSLFVLYCSDRFLQVMGLIGVALSILALLGISEQYGLFVSMAVWFLLWAIYQSFVNVGQIFYGYGWEILLLESGFLAIFLGSADVAPSALMIWLYRWVLFRMMFGAGLIKIRCDACWKDLTTMIFHYETQPLPGPLSRIFHRLPIFVHKFSVLFNHFIELIVPFFFFFPGVLGIIAGLLTVLFQTLLILSGNLSWLNYITVVLCFSCFPDSFLSILFPYLELPFVPVGKIHLGLVILLTGLVAYLSVKPIKNLLSHNQAMNRNFDPFNLVNTYGAFGSVTRARKEIIIEGTNDLALTENTKWLAYEFKAKPGSLTKKPPLVSPYHYKIDWQMWFAAMSSYQYHPWFIPFIQKLLEGEKEVLALLGVNPFSDKPPTFIRAELYEYHFAPFKNKEGVFWARRRLGEYLPPVHLIKTLNK
ncbi:MAG: lipase maturation factor family protein [Verrucomicrobia bacterium]|nr:lipase maturation factor family protein [Verrucomicrobiota bacterium]